MKITKTHIILILVIFLIFAVNALVFFKPRKTVATHTRESNLVNYEKFLEINENTTSDEIMRSFDITIDQDGVHEITDNNESIYLEFKDGILISKEMENQKIQKASYK